MAVPLIVDRAAEGKAHLKRGAWRLTFGPRGLCLGAMNYRHAYHAGNFADVLKHAVLAAVIAHLRQKATPFRVIDTHAGIGLYALDAPQAAKTEEWRAGIGRLIGPGVAPLGTAASAILAPYLDAVRAENGDGPLVRYPGSPWLARALIRPQDRLVLNELHPDDAAALKTLFGRDRQTKILTLDAWTALKSLLPPPERRGVVLVDPPFELAGELERLATGIQDAHRRFATGTLLLWYPIKDRRAIARFHGELAASGIAKLLAVEFEVGVRPEPGALAGCGLVILNPPHPLERDLAVVLPELTARLAQGPGARFAVTRLTGERGAPS